MLVTLFSRYGPALPPSHPPPQHPCHLITLSGRDQPQPSAAAATQAQRAETCDQLAGVLLDTLHGCARRLLLRRTDVCGGKTQRLRLREEGVRPLQAAAEWRDADGAGRDGGDGRVLVHHSALARAAQWIPQPCAALCRRARDVAHTRSTPLPGASCATLPAITTLNPHAFATYATYASRGGGSAVLPCTALARTALDPSCGVRVGTPAAAVTQLHRLSRSRMRGGVGCGRGATTRQLWGTRG